MSGGRLGRAARSRALLVLAALGLALVLFEVGFRAVRLLAGEEPPPPADAVWEFSADRHHRLIPGARSLHESAEYRYVWENNSLGMRDRERTWEKPPGTFRLFFLGDSFLQGHGVPLEECVTFLLEDRLNRPASPRRIEVVNGGVFGYSPFLENLYLREVVDRISPDLVLLGFFLGNDVGEDLFYAGKAQGDPATGLSFADEEWPWTRIVIALDGPQAAAGSEAAGGDAARAAGEAVRAGGEATGTGSDVAGAGSEPAGAGGDAGSAGGDAAGSGTEPAGPSPEGRVRRWKRAVVSGLVSVRLVRAAVRELLEDAAYRRRREREFALVADLREDLHYNLGLVNYPVLTRERRREIWETSRRQLRAIAGLCRDRGIPFVLVVIPPWERLDGTTDFAEPYEELDQLGQDLSVPVIQLGDAFAGKDPATLYYRYDRHWSPAGHRLAAQVLDGELRRLGLIPAVP